MCVSGIPDVGKHGINPAHSLNREEQKAAAIEAWGVVHIREKRLVLHKEVCFCFQVVSRIPAPAGAPSEESQAFGVPAMRVAAAGTFRSELLADATELLRRGCRSRFVLKFYLPWSHGAGWSLVCV